ncbi:hypothetical protein [Glycomyces albidus]|jgi:hypothetical protein|uniref:DUF4064 domain-containing protein n=1 Tax=Glycomyces albidus TaxID=2656774 RepID=A0A6L5G5B1_9ACTN|nr:hypothetical protein [Glycomyces albidus]MQM24801.1 hypothetical protein [Glycomyces albidus]
MLPQPNFGRDRDPGKGAPEPEGDDPNARPKKVLRLQIALWVQVVSAVFAGNFYALNVMSSRSTSYEEILEFYTENPPAEGTPEALARAAHDTFQSTAFLVAGFTIAGITILAAIIMAMCTLRFKTRAKAVRWWAVGATAVSFLVAMFMSTQFSLLVAPWVFGAVLALWWLFSSDIRYWMDGGPVPEPEADGDAKDEG